MRARSLTITIAAVLLGLFSLLNLVPLPVEGVPVFVVYLSIVLGVVGLVAAVGLWLLKRWSIWLTIIDRAGSASDLASCFRGHLSFLEPRPPEA